LTTPDPELVRGEKRAGRPRTFAHVSFHSMSSGQAAGVHVRAIFDALCRLGLKGVALNRGVGTGARLLGFVRVLLGALRWLGRVDVLYIRAHPAALPLVAAARLRVGTTIVEVNGTSADMTDSYPWMRFGGWLLAATDRAVLRGADGIVAVSPGLRDWVDSQTAGRTPVAVVPNAADPRRFHPRVAARPGLPSRYVAYCGALAPWQGVDTLIEATTHPRWPSGVRLVVAGEGPFRASLTTARCGGAPIDDLGVLTHEEVPHVVAGALAVVSPRSRRDASPVKLYEALACGVPVVASRVPGQAELVESRACGLTFPPGRSADLAMAVAAVSDEPDLRARLAASAHAAGREHTWDARAEAVLEFVASLRRLR
jgi:glycosyltransferase involved in cell wall biosynthesis